mmetsp:Transcript_24677/g.70998  ORF Transcript_24677/g.70998 Transcript_24677/m.70998 type:complete len:210 (+) Transcript_24677:1185-1814(+)
MQRPVLVPAETTRAMPPGADLPEVDGTQDAERADDRQSRDVVPRHDENDLASLRLLPPEALLVPRLHLERQDALRHHHHARTGPHADLLLHSFEDASAALTYRSCRRPVLREEPERRSLTNFAASRIPTWQAAGQLPSVPRLPATLCLALCRTQAGIAAASAAAPGVAAVQELLAVIDPYSFADLIGDLLELTLDLLLPRPDLSQHLRR